MTPLERLDREVQEGVSVNALKKEVRIAKKRLQLFDELIERAAEVERARKGFAKVALKFENYVNADTEGLDDWLAEEVGGSIDRDFIASEEGIQELREIRKMTKLWVKAFEANEPLLIEAEKEEQG
jgi:hypothetical protein